MIYFISVLVYTKTEIKVQTSWAVLWMIFIWLNSIHDYHGYFSERLKGNIVIKIAAKPLMWKSLSPSSDTDKQYTYSYYQLYFTSGNKQSSSLLTTISLRPMILMTLRMTSGGQGDPAAIPDRNKTEDLTDENAGRTPWLLRNLDNINVIYPNFSSRFRDFTKDWLTHHPQVMTNQSGRGQADWACQ